MGCPEFAVPALKALAGDPDFEIVHVYCMPDRPVGRGHKPGMNPVKRAAFEMNLPVNSPVKLRNNPDEISFLRSLQPDFLVVVAYGLILPSEVLQIPAIAPVNLHASILPKYRGPSPIHAALLNDDRVTGSTVMIMNERMDEGDTIGFDRIDVTPDESIASLHDKLSISGAKFLKSVLKDFALGKIASQPQNHSEATYTGKISAAVARIDWNRTASEIKSLVRAMTPCPGAWFELEGVRVKTGRVEEGEASSELPGRILGIDPEKGLIVACGGGTSLIIKTLQKPGKKMIEIGSFLRGFVSNGEMLK